MNKDCNNCDKTLEEHGPDECNPFAGMTFEEIEAEQTAYWNKFAKDSEQQYLESLRSSGMLEYYDERLWI